MGSMMLKRTYRSLISRIVACSGHPEAQPAHAAQIRRCRDPDGAWRTRHRAIGVPAKPDRYAVRPLGCDAAGSGGRRARGTGRDVATAVLIGVALTGAAR